MPELASSVRRSAASDLLTDLVDKEVGLPQTPSLFGLEAVNQQNSPLGKIRNSAKLTTVIESLTARFRLLPRWAHRSLPADS